MRKLGPFVLRYIQYEMLASRKYGKITLVSNCAFISYVAHRFYSFGKAIVFKSHNKLGERMKLIIFSSFRQMEAQRG